MSNGQNDNTKTPPKRSITQQLRVGLGRLKNCHGNTSLLPEVIRDCGICNPTVYF